MAVVVPDEFVAASGLSEAELRLEMAVLLFERERLTLGQASRLAGVPQPNFMHVLAQRGISLHYGVDEFEQDLRTLAVLDSVIVISDASPIVALARIDRLELLRQLYTRVLIPDAVHREVRAGSSGTEAILAATWIESRSVSDPSLIDRFAGQLDRGEAEAIALTIECRADLLLMDERRGRRIAGDLGLRVVGTLAVLVTAKQRGFVPRVAPLIDEMKSSGCFRVADDLRLRVLRAVGEDSATET